MFIRVNRAVRSRALGDTGFALLEVVIGLVLFAVIAQGLAAVLIASARGARVVRASTVAKNLAQQRIEAMRSLPYHVDAQNGAYVDLLDLYYHDASGNPDSLPNVVPGGAAVTVPGRYVAAGGGGGPAGPYYVVTINGSLLGSAYAGFTQSIYTQFLMANNPAATPLPATAVPATYDNTKVGYDQPVSPLVGVTIVTTWSAAGRSHVYQTFSEIANLGNAAPLVLTQASSTALRVVSHDYASNAITAELGDVTLNGSVASGSKAGAQATGAQINYGDNPPLLGSQNTAVAPPNPSGSNGLSAVAGSQYVGATGSCGWASFGRSQTADVSATTAGGRPTAPSDTTSGVTPAVSASIVSTGSGACDAFRLSNVVDGSPAASSATTLPAGSPMVDVQDLPTSGTNEVTGSASMYTGTQRGVAGSVTATSSAAVTTWVKVFPGSSWITANPPASSGITGLAGLVNLQLTSAKLTCSSTVGGGTSATLSYSGTVWWWSQSAWHQASFSLPASGPSATDPLAVVDTSKPVGAAGTPPLSTYITSLSGATTVTGNNGGLQSVNAAVAVSTMPTLSDPSTSVGVQLGQLSCVAQDNRS